MWPNCDFKAQLGRVVFWCFLSEAESVYVCLITWKGCIERVAYGKFPLQGAAEEPKVGRRDPKGARQSHKSAKRDKKGPQKRNKSEPRGPNVSPDPRKRKLEKVTNAKSRNVEKLKIMKMKRLQSENVDIPINLQHKCPPLPPNKKKLENVLMNETTVIQCWDIKILSPVWVFLKNLYSYPERFSEIQLYPCKE